MTLSGFSFVRNGFLFDYPFLESIRSILPICDEFVIAVGDSSDNTLDAIRGLNNPKIRIVETVWDESVRTGGRILADQTNIALDAVKGDWAFYLQADEVVHEDDLPIIRKALSDCADDQKVEGLLFSYKHFYGSYAYIGTSRRWYRREIRIVRSRRSVRSWGDAQGFRIEGRKMRVKLVNASIYHYGWVKSPLHQQKKQRSFNRYWHDDAWMQQHVGNALEYNYSHGGRLEPFTGSHPAVMKDRVEHQDWQFRYDPKTLSVPLRERLLEWVESRTGIRPGEYRNYILL